MPDGDTIAYAARRMRPVLVGRVPDEIHQDRHRRIYGRAGRPCPRCASPIRVRGQWEDNRPTFWCPGCQR